MISAQAETQPRIEREEVGVAELGLPARCRGSLQMIVQLRVFPAGIVPVFPKRIQAWHLFAQRGVFVGMIQGRAPASLALSRFADDVHSVGTTLPRGFAEAWGKAVSTASSHSHGYAPIT